jgi:hypothetical protein
MTNKHIFIWFSVFALFVLFGCTAVESGKGWSFTYSVGGCQQTKAVSDIPRMAQSGDIRAYWSGDDFIIEHDISYTCCANFTLSVNVSGDRIIISENNTGDVCKCMCTYNINATIKGLERKNYTLEMGGDEQSGRIIVDPSESCIADPDCVPAQCCHATSCVNKANAPKCEGVACTLDCRGGTMDCSGGCGCMNHKCSARLTGDTG